jgi:hypothetical protein
MFVITPTTYECPFSPTTHNYVEIPFNPATPTNNYEEDQLVVNLENPTFELNNLTSPSETQEVVQLINLLRLPQLPTRKRQGKKPLVDYSNSHVVTLDQYLIVLK